MINHLDVAEQEIKNSSYINEQFSERINLFNRCYDLFLESISESQFKLDNKEDRDFHRVYLTMCMKINCDIRVILNATKSGWFGTAHVIFREINDSFLKIALIAQQPENASLIINGKMNDKAAKKKAKQHGIISLLSPQAWGFLSNVKHAEGENIIAVYGGENSRLRFFPILLEEEIEPTLIYASGVILNVAETYMKFHIKRYGNHFIMVSFPVNVDQASIEIKKLISKQLFRSVRS